MEMNRIKEIKNYPNEIKIISNRKDKYKIHIINYENQQGEYTQRQWINEDLIMYNIKEQIEILDALKNVYNEEFFKEDEEFLCKYCKKSMHELYKRTKCETSPNGWCEID